MTEQEMPKDAEIERLRERQLRDERAMERLDKELTERTEETMRSRAQRDRLLAALRDVTDLEGSIQRVMHRVRAAIAAVEDRQP